MADAELLSSVLLVLETRRHLVRLTREGILNAEQYKRCVDRAEDDIARLFVLRDLTLDLCESHVWPAVATPRSLDLAHLRTALWFHNEEPIDRFITLDAAHAQAAREVGLPVSEPSADSTSCATCDTIAPCGVQAFAKPVRT